MTRSRNDIKAPDGYTLGGLRKVRKDGTILFGRGWWEAPDEWVGEEVWVHEHWTLRSSTDGFGGEMLMLEAAPPGEHIYSARRAGTTVLCDRTKRPDAAPTYRRALHREFAAKARGEA